MANNIKAGLNFLVAKTNADWDSIGLLAGNTVEIYATENGLPLSWRPDKQINTLTAPGIVAGNGYLLNSKVVRDLTAFFIPPFPDPVILIPEEVPFSESISAMDFEPGEFSANSLSPNFENVAGDSFYWEDSQRYLRTTDSFGWLVKTKTKTRDHEITINVGRGTIFLRVDDTGKAWFLNFNVDTTSLKLGVCTNANTNGAVLEEFGPYGYLLVESVVYDAFVSTIRATDTITLGCSGFEIYIKISGVELLRYKSQHHCKPGYAGVKLYSISNGYLRTFNYQSFARVSTFSNTDTNTTDIQDFGAVPNAKTTGSMSAGSYNLTVADASKFPEGCTVIVATGGEAPWMGRSGIGTIGVGGVYPALHYPDVTTMQADRTKPDNLRCFVDSTGLQYQNSTVDNTWNIASYLYEVTPGQNAISKPYDQYAIPIALRAKVVSKAGNVLTLDKPAAVGTTAANVYYDSSYAISRLLFNPAEEYFTSGNYPKTIASNMGPAAVIGRKISMPAGEFYTGEDIYKTAEDIIWEGAGNDQTILISPNGASAFNVWAQDCSRSIARNFKCIGNTRTDTYSGRWESWWGYLAARINDQYWGIANDTTTPWGFGYLFSNDVIAENITLIDIWWVATGSKQQSKRAYRKNIRVERTAPLLQYIQWHFQDPTDSEDGIFEDCVFDSDYLTPAFETFSNENTQFINCTARNGLWSSNNGGHFTIQGCTQIFDGAQPRPAWMHPNMPALSVNTNIGSGKVGGLIDDHDIIITAYQDAANNEMTGIVVNEFNADIQITNSSYSGLAKIGGALGPRAIISTGTNITVDGFTATGAIGGDNFYNANVSVWNGTVKKVHAPSIFVTSAVTLGTGPDANVGTVTVI